MMSNKKGITLIALIITIIVMIILVVVTLRAVTNGGLFSKAKKASDEYIVAMEKEKITAAVATWKGIKYSTQEKTFITCLRDELPETNVEQNDEEGNEAKVTFRDTKHSYIVTEDGKITEDQALIITFKTNGGELAEKQVKSAYKGDTVTLLNPSKDKAYFMGWYFKEDFSGDRVSEIRDIQENKTVYAKWVNETPDEYFTWDETTSNGVTTARVTGLTNLGRELSEIVIPSTHNGKNVTYITGTTFKNNSNMKVLCIPESVTGMNIQTFNGSTNLEDLTIPISLQAVQASYNYFTECTKLKNVHFLKGSGVGPGYGAGSNGYNYTKMPWYISNADVLTVEFDEGITTIGANTFLQCNNVRVIEAPSTITAINASAFQGCTSLQNEDVTKLLSNPNVSTGNYAFAGCTGITGYLNLDDIAVASYMFQGCTGIEEVSLNKSIGRASFNGCSSLKRIAIGENASMNIEAFLNCSGLEDLTIPISLQAVQASYNYFSGCTKLKNVHFLKGSGVGPGYGAGNNGYNYTKMPWYISNAEVLTVTFDEGITTIGANTFLQCENVRVIEAPSTLTNINASAFQGCTSLQTEDLLKLLTPNITYGNYAFAGCTSITGFLNLDEINVGSYMFQGCTGIGGASVNGNVPAYAFSGCSGLKELIIGENATLQIYSLNNMAGIEELTMPISTYAASTGFTVFSGCSNVKKVHFTKGTGVGPNYGQGSGYTYACTNTPWYYSKDHDIEITFDEGITNIGNNMFKGTTGLKKIIYKGQEYTSKSAFASVFPGTISSSAFTSTGLSN